MLDRGEPSTLICQKEKPTNNGLRFLYRFLLLFYVAAIKPENVQQAVPIQLVFKCMKKKSAERRRWVDCVYEK